MKNHGQLNARLFVLYRFVNTLDLTCAFTYPFINSMASQPANKQALTFRNTLAMAFCHNPFSKNVSVSTENVEKVVNAPKRPTPISARYGESANSWRSIKPYNVAKANEPTTFTASVPKGKFFPNHESMVVVQKYRKQAPIAPPAAI